MEPENDVSVAAATEVSANENRQPESAAVLVPEQRAAENTEKATSPDATNTATDRQMSDVHSETTQTKPEPTEAHHDDVMEVDGDNGDDGNAGKQAETTGLAEAAAVAESSNGVNMPDAITDAAQPETTQQEESAHVTDALEAALNSMLDGDDGANSQGPREEASVGVSAPASEQQAAQQEPQQEQQEGDAAAAGEEEGGDGQGVEWEVDSSPYESSSSDSDSDSSDDSDSDEEDQSGAAPVGLQDTVRMLMESAAMQEMYEDDDEEDGGGRGGGDGVVRSKNEIPEEAPPKPDVKIGPDEQVLLLGQVMHLVENAAVIKGTDRASHPDSGRVLDTGTVLCTAAREVLGVIADVIGNVRGPVYVLRVPREEDLAAAGLVPGADVYYAPKHAVYVFTEALRGIKGSDASNLHDEEVGAEEAEFSDDEKEAAYKRELKARRRGGGGGGGDSKNNRSGGGGGGGGGGNHAQRNAAPHTSGGGGSGGGLRYDDNNDDDDGPYKPLARPANFGHGPPPPPPRGPSGGVGGGGAGFGRGGNRGAFRGQQRFGRGGGRGGRGGHGGRGGAAGGGSGGGWNNSGGGAHSSGRYNDRPPMPAAPAQPAPQQGSGSGVAYFHGAPQTPQYQQPYQQQHQPPPSYQQHQPPPPPPPQQQSVPAAWPFTGLSFPPPPPPPPASSHQPLAVQPSAANIAAAAALLSNLQQQQYWQQQQHQQPAPPQPPAQPSWPPAVPMTYAQPQPQSHATPQFPAFPQWPPAQPGWGQQQEHRPPSA